MDDCDIEPTSNDPEFDPYECESTYALWAFKEEGEPVKFLEASLVENPDCPSGYSFCWRTLSLCDRTGKLVDRFGGDIGDVSRADYSGARVVPRPRHGRLQRLLPRLREGVCAQRGRKAGRRHQALTDLRGGIRGAG